MIVVNDENYEFDVYKRINNTAYEWEHFPSIQFKGRPANRQEVKTYRILQGVNGNSDSCYIITSNLPETIKPKDQVFFLGKMWTVESVGYYYDSNLIVNPRILSNEAIISKCPKGINLQ